MKTKLQSETKMKIMVVDDTPANIDVLCQTLQTDGYEFAISPDGETALNIAPRFAPDLILLDIMMPGIDGYETCRILKEYDQTKDIPVIFITAKNTPKDLVKGFAVGGADFITKPFCKEEVLVRVRNQLQLKKYSDQLQSINKEMQEHIDKLETAQNQAVQSMKLASVGRLAAGVCHEILNPVNIISGISQALALERAEDTDLLQDMNSMIEEIRRIDKIVSGLLIFSRNGLRQKNLVCVNEILESVLSFMEPQLKSDGIQVVRQFGKSLPRLYVDKDSLRQVFINIIDNAKSMMNTGGHVTLKTELLTTEPCAPGDEQHSVKISISDSGPGIKKEDIDKIFEAFFTTKPENVGTGLGLSICHSIIHQNGGTLDVESEYGHGATFIIDLPVEQKTEDSALLVGGDSV